MSSNAIRADDFLIIVTAIDQPAVPLRIFQDRTQAGEWQVHLIDYHLGVPECSDDDESWDDYEEQLAVWQQGHLGGIAVALPYVPTVQGTLHGLLMSGSAGIGDQLKQHGKNTCTVHRSTGEGGLLMVDPN